MRLSAAGLWLLLEACASSQPSPKAPQPSAPSKETAAERFRRDAKRRQEEDDERRRREEFMQRNNARLR